MLAEDILHAQNGGHNGQKRKVEVRKGHIKGDQSEVLKVRRFEDKHWGRA